MSNTVIMYRGHKIHKIVLDQIQKMGHDRLTYGEFDTDGMETPKQQYENWIITQVKQNCICCNEWRRAS